MGCCGASGGDPEPNVSRPAVVSLLRDLLMSLELG